jgi:hypothetical protein
MLNLHWLLRVFQRLHSFPTVCAGVSSSFSLAVLCPSSCPCPSHRAALVPVLRCAPTPIYRTGCSVLDEPFLRSSNHLFGWMDCNLTTATGTSAFQHQHAAAVDTTEIDSSHRPSRRSSLGVVQSSSGLKRESLSTDIETSSQLYHNHNHHRSPLRTSIAR